MRYLKNFYVIFAATMIVHKFGGASVKDAESICKLPLLLSQYKSDRVFIVISAMGKTTNRLEAIVDSVMNGSDYVSLFEVVRNEHLFHLNKMILQDKDKVVIKMNMLFDQCLNVIESVSKDNYDYFYDQVVSFGERFSSFLVEQYLIYQGFDIKLVDASEIFLSNERWRAGNINIEATKHNLKHVLQQYSNRFLITQGFIASTDYGDSVTIGREGSDYSASIIASLSGAEEIVFWKDVDGIFSADPNIFSDSVKINEISYGEMIELSFFGAKVLHEKTLFSLAGNNIITKVKSFNSPEKRGSLIGNFSNLIYPPVKILSTNQILYTVEPKVKLLISAHHIRSVYDCANKHNVNIRLIQISALKISFCCDYEKRNCEKMLEELNGLFIVKYNNDVSLITLRHYTTEDIAHYTNKEKLLLSQASRNTAQFVFKKESI